MNKPSTRQSPHLNPALGLVTTITIVVGAVVGSGIFRTPGSMAADLSATGVGSETLLIALWIGAGIITLLGAMSNAEVSSMIPETGGQYVYFERMYGRFPAFLYGWSVFSVIQTGSIAAIAYVFAEYTVRLLGLPQMLAGSADFSVAIPLIGEIRPFFEFSEKVIAAGAIAALTIVNYLGVRFGGIVQLSFTLLKIAALLLLGVLAFLLDPATAHGAVPSSAIATAASLPLLAGIAGALQGAFWTYDGWNNVTYIAGEVRDPQRSIPRALVVGLGTIIVTYLVVNLAYAHLLPFEEMAQSKLVASDAADRLFTDGGRWIALLVAVSTFGTVNGTILASARVYFSMARNGLFPSVVGRVHPRFRTPSGALTIQAGWSIVLLFSGTFNTLIDMLLFVSWVFYAAGGIGLFVLRHKEPDTVRPYRVPLYPVVPALFSLFALAYVVLTLYNDVVTYQANIAAGEPALFNAGLGTLLVLAGAPLYLYYRNRASRHEEEHHDG